MSQQRTRVIGGKTLPLIVAGKYVYHPKDSTDVYYRYYILTKNGTYRRAVKHVPHQTVQGAIFTAMNSGFIYTNDEKVFQDQS